MSGQAAAPATAVSGCASQVHARVATLIGGVGLPGEVEWVGAGCGVAALRMSGTHPLDDLLAWAGAMAGEPHWWTVRHADDPEATRLRLEQCALPGCGNGRSTGHGLYRVTPKGPGQPFRGVCGEHRGAELDLAAVDARPRDRVDLFASGLVRGLAVTVSAPAPAGLAPCPSTAQVIERASAAASAAAGRSSS